jgi:protein-tyrosine kinase
VSLIEQAAKRLEELRRAGVSFPESNSKPSEVPPAKALKEVLPGDNPTSPLSTRSPSQLAEKPIKGDAQRPIAHTDRSEAKDESVVERASRPQFDLNLAKLAANGFVTPDMPRSRIADEFRVLKRPLIGNVSGDRVVPIKHANLIMVTSSVPGEGKTFSAINLAMSIAMELDKTVLLVDADVARPSLPKVLGVSHGKGLLDVLKDKSIDLSEVLIRTNVEKLSLLQAGTQHSQATELLASAEMARLLDEISMRYEDRIIIFDSPPLLVTTEARVLATQMGQIVFVVNAENTLQRDVKQALATIEACPLKMMVLNQVRTVAQGAYGYGYHE